MKTKVSVFQLEDRNIR